MGFIAPVVKFLVIAYKTSKIFAFAVKLVALVGLNAVTSKLFGPDLPKQGFSGPQIMVRSAVEYRKKVYGQALISGPIVYNNLSGSNGQTLWYQVALCEGEIEDILEIHFDGDVIPKADIAWTAGAGGADGSGTGVVSTSKFVGKDSTTAAKLYYYLGHPDQVVSSVLNSAFTDIGTNHRLRGVAHVITQLLYDKKTEKVWQAGSPNDIRALVKGSKIYDRRKDALNADPDFATLARPKQFGGGLKWSDSTFTAKASLIDNADSYSVSAGVLTVSDNDNTANIAASDKIPVDLAKTYTASVDARQVSGDRDNSLYVVWFDANDDIIDMTSDAATGWLSKGVAGTKFAIDGDVFAGSTTTYSISFGASGSAQFPQGTTAVKMALMLTLADDGTTDTTVEVSNAHIREGTGTRHDFSDDSTWEWSDNSSMCIADYLTQDMGVAYDRIGWESFIASAQFDDELVAIPTSSTEKRFTCNGVISFGDSHKDNLDKLLSSNDGFLTRSQGIWRLRSSQWEAPTITVTPDDLAGPIDVRGSAPTSERFNTIIGVFIDPNRHFEVTEFPHVSAAAYITRDNGRVIKRDLTLPMTNSVTMAQRIAFRLLERGNNQEAIKVPMNTRGAKIGIGEVVKLDFAELGWTDAENILLYSEDLSNTWLNTSSTDSQAVAIGPFGANTANSIDEDGTAATSHYVRQLFTAEDDTIYTFSVYLKESARSWARIDLVTRDNITIDAFFDLGAGAIGTVDANAINADMENVGNGWYRCSITADLGSGGTSERVRVVIAEGDNDITFDGLSQASILLFGAQLEAAREPTQYKKTTSASVTSAPRNARCVEWERSADGIYNLLFRNDDEGDYADPLEGEYGIESSPSFTEGTQDVPAPDNLTATADRAGVLLDWDDPPSRLYDHIEVWASADNDRDNAVLIANVPTSPYMDNVSDKLQKRYYWVRSVRNEDDVSAWEPDSSTTTASAAPLPPAGNLLLDPDFELSTDLDADQFWNKDVFENGTPGATASAMDLTLTGGANNGPYVTFTVGNPTGVGAAVLLDLIHNNRVRISSTDFVVRIRYRCNSSIGLGEFSFKAVGYSAVTGGSSVTTVSKRVPFGNTSNVWTDIFIAVVVPGSATAQFWDLSLEFTDGAPVDGGYDLDVDSIFVYSTNTDARVIKVAHNTITSASGTLTIDLQTGNSFQCTLSENITTITINNVKDSGDLHEFELEFIQDSTARTVTMPASTKSPNGVAYTPSTGSGDRDRLHWQTRDGGTTWDVTFVKKLS